ncbi:MAG TPA: potassium-transporting ATPase subunit KdpA [Devosia sp.]|nr:potassium-transporting ATPase subunit KdpA [Devosia sp.]
MAASDGVGRPRARQFQPLGGITILNVAPGEVIFGDDTGMPLLIMSIGVLAVSALAIVFGTAQTAVPDAGPHRLTELLYAYSSDVSTGPLQ